MGNELGAKMSDVLTSVKGVGLGSSGVNGGMC